MINGRGRQVSVPYNQSRLTIFKNRGPAYITRNASLVTSARSAETARDPSIKGASLERWFPHNHVMVSEFGRLLFVSYSVQSVRLKLSYAQESA